MNVDELRVVGEESDIFLYFPTCLSESDVMWSFLFYFQEKEKKKIMEFLQDAKNNTRFYSRASIWGFQNNVKGSTKNIGIFRNIS